MHWSWQCWMWYWSKESDTYSVISWCWKHSRSRNRKPTSRRWKIESYHFGQTFWYIISTLSLCRTVWLNQKMKAGKFFHLPLVFAMLSEAFLTTIYTIRLYCSPAVYIYCVRYSTYTYTDRTLPSILQGLSSLCVCCQYQYEQKLVCCALRTNLIEDFHHHLFSIEAWSFSSYSELHHH